jgi:hypothetical protein
MGAEPTKRPDSMPPRLAVVERSESGQVKDLLNGVGLDLYRVNGFRLTCLSVDATPREVARHLEKVEMLQKFGQPVKLPGPLQLDPPPDGDALREAKQRLNDPQRRIIDEFFWFWPDRLGESRTDEALIALSNGDAQRATELWIRNENDHSEANVAMHNLAVFSHAWALDLENKALLRSLSEQERQLRDKHWRVAFSRWRILLSHAPFWSRLAARIHQLDDPRLTTAAAEGMRESLPLALLSINAQLALRAAERNEVEESGRHRTMMLNSGFGQKIVDEAMSKVVREVRQRIKVLCRTSESQADRNPESANESTRNLVRDTKPLLKVLQCLLLPGHPVRDGAHDEVALCALACQIPFGNKTQNWEECMDLLNLAFPIVVSETARKRIEENAKIVQGNVEYKRDFETCWFCRVNQTSVPALVTVKMYGNVNHVYGQVRWQIRELKVPRCEDCKVAHLKPREKTFRKFGVAAGVLFYVLLSIRFPVLFAFFWILPFVLGAWGGAIGGFLARSTQTQTRTIQPEKHATAHPLIKKAYADGWRVGAKPPGVR